MLLVDVGCCCSVLVAVGYGWLLLDAAG